MFCCGRKAYKINNETILVEKKITKENERVTLAQPTKKIEQLSSFNVSKANLKKSDISGNESNYDKIDENKEASPKKDSSNKKQEESEINVSRNSFENKNKDELNVELDNDLQERRGGVRSHTIEFKNDIEKYEKNKEDETAIKNALKGNEFLKYILKEDQMQAIIDVMHPKEVEPKETIIKQGQDGDRMYVSGFGKFQIIVDKKVIDHFHDNRIFGELAILYNTPRLATVKAITKGKVWILDRNIYKQIIRQSAMAEDEERLQFLRNVPEINKATDIKLQKISNLFVCEFFKTNVPIVKQGDKGEKFYIIKSGTATVSVNGQGNVANLTRGQFFGERALLQDDVRQATVKADSPGAECLILSRKDFNKYLGDLPTFISREDPSARAIKIQTEFNFIEFKDLLAIKVIGSGGFGRVSLVQYRENPDMVFALKYMKKANILKQGQKKQAYHEKSIQMSCRSRFIVRLYKTYQDKKYLYYLMECCLGGDLWSLLVKQKRRCFEEETARFIAACVLEALAYLHDRNFAYLDLKPENVLIDSQGYIKLSDFGNAIELVGNQKTFTFAGTPEYVAPEIIYEKGHDKAADYWAFGIFIFELLVGKTPFKTNDPSYMKTYTLIVKGIERIIFPSRVSKPAEEIIKKLCKANKTKRLGCGYNGIKDIKEHRWFSTFNWKKLELGELTPPFVPSLEGKTDTKYFEKVHKDVDIPADCEMWDDF